MQVGNVWLKIDGFGSNIQIFNATPAEVAILNENHEVNAKTKEACFDLTDVREEKRDNEAEITRLREKYVNAKDKKGEILAEKLYPGKNPVLPQKFEEVGLKPAAVTASTKPEPPAPAQPSPVNETKAPLTAK